MKTIFTASVLLICTASISAQSELIYVSPKADSLGEVLLQNSSDYPAQIKLMNEYIENAHPELGLLEILDLENAGEITSDNLVQKAKILFWLQRGDDALHEFVRSYLYDPNDELIKYLIVSDYAAGNTARGLRQLKKYSAVDPDLTMDIARLYQELYLNKRYTMASASQNLLRDFDKTLHDKLFPIPSIFMLTSEDELYSTEDEITITFEVRHGVQIRTISINGDPVYKLDENIDRDPKTPFSKTFNKTLKINSGVNEIAVQTEDVYGYKASQSIEVKGLKFPKTQVFASALSDSLSKRYRIFDSYIPSDSTNIEKDRSGRALFFAPELGDSESKSNIEFWYRFVTNRKTGMFSPENIKFLMNDEATISNFYLIFDKWLMKEANLQTTALFYLSGTWEFSDSRYKLKCGNGVIDPINFVNAYSKKISKALYLVLDSVQNADSAALSLLKSEIDKANFPVEVMAVQSHDFPELLTHDFSSPADSVDSLYTSGVRFENLDNLYESVKAVSNGKSAAYFTQNPAQTIREMHHKLFEQLEDELKKEKLGKKKIPTVLEFCSDWRRYGEMKRFYETIITADELYIQAEEYFSREAGGENEN